jgi:hypothetical protein
MERSKQNKKIDELNKLRRLIVKISITVGFVPDGLKNKFKKIYTQIWTTRNKFGYFLRTKHGYGDSHYHYFDMNGKRYKAKTEDDLFELFKPFADDIDMFEWSGKKELEYITNIGRR